MRKADVISYFGTQQKVAEELELSQSTIGEWPEVIPIAQAFIVERLTKGKAKGQLKVDFSLYPKVPARLRQQ